MTKPLDRRDLAELGVLGRTTTLEGVRDLLIARRKQLGLPQRAVDDLAGYADGYTAKIEARIKGLGKDSLPCLLGALGLELLVVPAMLEPQKHLGSSATSAACNLAGKNYWRQRTLKARTLAAQKMSPKQRRERARAAAQARWSRSS